MGDTVTLFTTSRQITSTDRRAALEFLRPQQRNAYADFSTAADQIFLDESNYIFALRDSEGSTSATAVTRRYTDVESDISKLLDTYNSNWTTRVVAGCKDGDVALQRTR